MFVELKRIIRAKPWTLTDNPGPPGWLAPRLGASGGIRSTFVTPTAIPGVFLVDFGASPHLARQKLDFEDFSPRLGGLAPSFGEPGGVPRRGVGLLWKVLLCQVSLWVSFELKRIIHLKP